MAKLLHTLIKTNSTQNSSIRSDEGLTLETSAFQIVHGGNSTLIDTFDKTKISCFTLPPTQHHSFFRNYKLVFKEASKCLDLNIHDFAVRLESH